MKMVVIGNDDADYDDDDDDLLDRDDDWSRCYGRTGCNKSLRSAATREEGDKWENRCWLRTQSRMTIDWGLKMIR